MSAVDDLINAANAKRSTVAGPRGFDSAAVQQQRAQPPGGGRTAVDSLLDAHGGSFTAGRQTDMTGTYRQWYTGRNLDGTGNGWDTEFMRVFMDGRNKAYEEGRLLDYYSQPRATGVVLWDNAAGQGGTRFTFGDVVVDGKKVGNVYDDFDKHTANVMMGDYLIETGARKAELNKAGSPESIKKQWDKEISEIRRRNTQMAEVAPRAERFEKDVKERVESEEDPAWKVAFTGMAGSAALGAGAGSMVGGPVGAAVGAIGMGLIGGIGAWMNSDSLRYQVARSREQHELARGEAQKIQAALSGWSQGAMSIAMSPLSNMLQGSYDVAVGQGPGKGALGGAFYETNETGDRRAGAAWQAAGYGTLLGDSLLQFASPLGQKAYQAQMMTQIGSGVLGLMPGVGQWDQRTYEQNSIWTREEIDPATGQTRKVFDLGNSVAGVASVGIDAVQLGGMSALARQSQRLSAQTAARTGQPMNRWAKSFSERPWERLNLSPAQRQAVREGAEIETRSGFKFVVNEAGEVVGKQRMTLALLAPSEGLQALSAKMLARRDAARRGGAVSAEDLYQTAAQLAIGQRGLQAMMLNAVGEAQEEVAQAFLEPWSQDHKVSAEEVVRAGLSGAASGFGMTAGTRLGRPSQDLQMFAAGMVAHEARTGGDVLSYEQWQGMTELQKRTLVRSASGMAKAVTDAAFDKIESDRVRAVIGGVVEGQAALDYWRDEQEGALKSGAVATDQASVIVEHESSTFRPEAIATSHTQLLTNQKDRTLGATTQLDELGKEIAKRKVAVPDPAAQASDELLQELTEAQTSLRRVVGASKVLERLIGRSVDAIDSALAAQLGATTDAEKDRLGDVVRSEIGELNDTLEAMFDMTDDTYEFVMEDGSVRTVTLDQENVLAYSKAVSRLMTRDPADSKGSWQILLPQVSEVWSVRGVDGLYGVSQIILQPIRGDYDGDKMRNLQQLIVSDQRFKDIRSGANILGPSQMPDIGSSKFEKFLTGEVMRAWRSRNTALRDAAHKVARDIERSLYSRYHNVPAGRTPIPQAVIRDVSAAALEALKNGQDVRKTVLEMMNARTPELTRIGRGEYTLPGMPRLSNEAYWIANEITVHLQTFQSALAMHTPTKGEFDLSYKATAPNRASTRTRSTVPRRGGTEGMTMIQEMPGSNMFRMFQKLHYTLWETTEKYIGFARDASNEQYVQLVQFYEQVSQGVASQRLERGSASDRILAEAMSMLQLMSADPVQLKLLNLSEKGNMALIANMGVPQMVWGEDAQGTRQMKYTGKSITIGQHVLYLALERFKSENIQIWNESSDLRGAYNSLFELTQPPTQNVRSAGNAELAFVKLFESVRLYDIVGVDAVSLGVNRTVGQKWRELMSIPVDERKQEKYALKEGAYSDAADGFTIPFGEAAVEKGAVTAYKSLVDSLFSAADSSISMNLTGKDKGKPQGRLAKRAADRSEEFRATWRAVRLLLQKLEPKSGPYTAEDISRIANENPEFGSALMKTIPREAMPHVIREVEEDGTVHFASWFYEVWTQETAEAAEMSYVRNYIMSTWHAKALKLRIDASLTGVEKKIAYHDLTSRMHRVMFRLSSDAIVYPERAGEIGADPTRLQMFMNKLNEAKSVEEFEHWVNVTEGMNLEGAPLLLWMDDVAVFDADKAGGGWTNDLSTPVLMEHISNLRATAERMIGNLAADDARMAKDLATARRIQNWHRHLQDPDNPKLRADPKDGALYDQFVALIKRAAEQRMSNGPRAMLQHTAHVVYGMYGPAHAKGEHPEQMAANSALEALDNAIGYLTPFEHILGDWTAHSVDDVQQSTHMILRDGGRAMDNFGSPVEWEMASVDALLPVLLDPKRHRVMRSMLYDSVIELDSDNVARRKFLNGASLEEVLVGQTGRDLFPDDGNPNLTQSMKFLAKLEMGLRDTEKHQLEQKVTELVINRATALDHPASFEEIQSMTTRAYMDYAALLQVVGQTEKLPGQDDPVSLAHDDLKEATTVASLASAFNINATVLIGGMEQLRDVVKKTMIMPYEVRIDRMLTEVEQGKLSISEKDQLIEEIKGQKAVRDAAQAKIDRMFDLKVTDTIVSQHLYNSEASPLEKHQRQTHLMEYVYHNGELMQAAGPAMPLVQAIFNHYEESSRNQKVDPFILKDEEWELLSDVIISVELQRLFTVSPAASVAPPYPRPLEPGKKGIDKRKYMDHSRSYLFDFLSEKDESGIVQAARRIAAEAGMLPPRFGREEVSRKVLDTVMRFDELGPWDETVPILAVESSELLKGASAIPSVSMYGLLQQRWGAVMQATERQDKGDPAASATVTLTGTDLNWERSGHFHDVEVTAGNGQTYLRPMAQMNNRFVEELSFTYAGPNGAGATPIDLMTNPNVARGWVSATNTAVADRLKRVNLSVLRAELERYLLDQHPDMALDDLKAMLGSARVTMRFVNPDDQPGLDDQAAADNANSVWYEGTVFASEGDVGPSLVDAFLYGVAGANAVGQQAALDTRKLGLMGIEDYLRPLRAEIEEVEKDKNFDFARMIARKAAKIMDTPISNGKPMDVEFYNGAYKIAKLMHWVEGVDKSTNVRTRWSAEQVIDWQMQHVGEDFFGPNGPLEDANLWIPAAPVLADMMGDIGFGGVRGRALKRDVTVDLSTIPRYTSRWTEEMERKFPVSDSQPKHLMDTDVSKQAYVQDLVVSDFVTPQERTRFRRRAEGMRRKRKLATDRRILEMKRPTFNPVANAVANTNTAINWVAAMDVTMRLPAGREFLAMENADRLEGTLTTLDAYLSEQQGLVGRNASSVWIFQEVGQSNSEQGLLTKEDLDGGLNIVPGEVVVFDTAAYQNMDPEKGRKKALERIDYFVNEGATLLITSSDGHNSLISELQRMTVQRHGYQRYANNPNILIPDTLQRANYQNVAAQQSRLTGSSSVEIARQRLSLLTLGRELEENTMVVPVRPGHVSKFDTIQAVFDLLPIDANAKFNSANTADDAEMVQLWIEGFGDLTSPGVDLLRQESLRHLYEVEDDGTVTTNLKSGVTQEQLESETRSFDEAWQRLRRALPDRVAANRTEPLPGEDFRTGDFIPLINTQTRELLLYRHGYSYPNWQDYQRQMRNQVRGEEGQRNTVIYSGKRQPQATTHSGTVVSIQPSPGRGFRLELEVPVAELGQKIVFEHNGMKYVLTDMSDSMVMPDLPLFGNVRIDGVASLHDVLSKEALSGLVTSFSPAFTVFGIDFREDVRKFFNLKNTDEAVTLLRKLSRAPNKKTVEEIYQLQSLLAGQDTYLAAITEVMPSLVAAGVDTTTWFRNLQDLTPEAFIVRAMLIYLMSPNADVEAILSSTGFNVDNPSLPGAASQGMPELFTRAFDLAPADSPIKEELSRRINKEILNRTGDESWHLDVNSWELEGRSRGQAIRGVLQFGEAHTSDDNLLLNLQAQERKTSQSASVHAGLMNTIGTGGFLRPTKARKKLAQLDSLRKHTMPTETERGALWRDLTFVNPQTYGPGSRWQRRTAAEHRFYATSLQRMALYRHKLDLDSEVFTKDAKLRDEITAAITTIRDRLDLRPAQEDLVHYWIRQVLYHPAEGADQQTFSGDLSPNDVLGAARTILGNLDLGYLPTYDGAGPSFFSFHDLNILFQASQRNEKAWRPSRIEGDRRSVAQRDNLGDWIAIAFGQAINEKAEFDPIYRLDFAGFMNTYQTVLRNNGYLMDITFDKDYQRKLLDPETNEMVSVTIDPVENTRLNELVLLATTNLEYEDLMTGASTTDSSVWRSRRLNARARWRARHKVRPVKVQSTRDYLRNGTEVINKDADMHSLQRIVIALRHGTTMLNPGLYGSMLLESGYKMWLSEVSNAITGESTLRSVAGVQRGVDRLAGALTGGRLQTQWAQYTPERIRDLNELFKTMGNDGGFTAHIMGDVMWKRQNDSPGRVVSFFERFASIGNKWQDPTWGTTQKALARHYFEAVVRYMEATPTRNVMTVDNIIAHLKTDPLYFAKHMPEVHQAASNFVSDFRSLKNTPLSLAIKSVYEPWSQSSNGIKRFAGTLLKLQGMYATYNMNMLTSLTGMQGYSDMVAVFLEGRRKPGSWLKMWWKSRDGQEPTDEDRETFDMSTTLDGVTIANSFIRGGVTHTGLFLAGMAFGGILSGEDDEAKRRRRLAEAQNVPLIMDPRRLETDFRNKDVIFLDWLPDAWAAPFRGPGDDGTQGARAAVQISWILKPFLSPILGMERFFMTGDFSYVTHGFMDAIGSLPLFNKRQWDDATRTADELVALAAEEQQAGTPLALKNTMYLLTSAVGMYESMLFENMFVNSLYTGFDTYDRDPTKLVLRDSDGVIQRTIENNARPNDLALTDYVGEEGDIGQGYMKRDPISANIAAFTENNFTAAAVLSLFKPFHGQEFLRGNMPVRTQTIKMPELTEDEAKIAVILATMNGQQAKGQLERRLSLDEITSQIKGEALARKDWDTYNNLDAIAERVYLSDANPLYDPLSIIGPDGQEVLTKSGHAALFKGLMAGTIDLDDPEMRGIAITPETRKEIEKDFYEDMTRQGIDLGLTRSLAEKRATRLMLGPIEDKTIIGFREILWDKRIPWTADPKYKQLNTTYVQGPDGFPWATGYKRGGAPGGGFWSLFGGVKRPTIGMTDAAGVDGRLNSTDEVRGINTGLRALVPMNETELIPTDWEQTKKLIDAIEGHSEGFSSYAPNSRDSGNGSGSFYRRGYGGGYRRYGGGYGGGGGGRGYSPTIYWSRQPTLPRGTNVYGNFARNLFWNNANIRRTTIRRERYQAARGRLNQWQ